MSLAAGALVKQVIFAEVPLFPSQAVLAHEFVAGMIQIRKALEYVRAKESMLVVHYGTGTLMTFLGFELNVQWYQSRQGPGPVLDYGGPVKHPADIYQFEGVPKCEEGLEQPQVGIQVLIYPLLTFGESQIRDFITVAAALNFFKISY